jgi:surface antigen
MPDILGNARDYFDPAVAPGKMNYRRGMIQYLNGGEMKPQIDDLLVFNNSPYGHLAIVTKTDSSSIEIIQQNANRQTRQILTLHCQNGKYEIEILGRLAG